MKKKITILGSTGSIGTQALEVISKINEDISITALSAGKNIDLLRTQIKSFHPETVCVQDEADAMALEKEFKDTHFCFGRKGLVELAKNSELDLLLVAVSGKVGLEPTLEAIKAKTDIALANKETLVMAGDITMQAAKENGVKILPVDSEHSAIFQCLSDKDNLKYLRKLIITASGGPFRNSTVDEIENATVKEALAHPKWNMGKKITIDSATLMNKGLEIIEAHHLFGVDYNDIKVVIHPQSIIHSAIEYNDGSVIAQLGVPSMHIPIQYAISYPQRVEGIKTESFDFTKIARLDFEEPDLKKFPCLKLAMQAGKLGGLYPVALNASNEEAVFAFLKGKINLSKIAKIVEATLSKVPEKQKVTLDEIFEYDEMIRRETREATEKI